MNKYQEHAFSSVQLVCLCENNEKAQVKVVNGKIEITQHENYNIVKYDLIVSGANIEKVEYFTTKWNDSNVYDEKYNSKIVPVDFDQTPSKVKISFVGGLIDPIELPIKYIPADKETWDQKNKEKMMADYEFNLSLMSATGTTFFRTLYFRPCSSLCEKTVVEWYAISQGTKTITDSRGSRKTETVFVKYFLSKDEITDDRGYSNSPSVAKDQTPHEHVVSIGGGSYRPTVAWSNKGIGYIIKQYDAKGNLLIEVASSEMPK